MNRILFSSCIFLLWAAVARPLLGWALWVAPAHAAAATLAVMAYAVAGAWAIALAHHAALRFSREG